MLGATRQMIQRRGNRTKAVLPVKVKGMDKSGKPFEDLAHTLDVTAAGARLGGIRHELSLQEEITVFYRQRKTQFRVVWIKKMQGSSEFQIGLQALSQDKEGWGLGQEQSGMAVKAPLSMAQGSV